MYYVISLAHTYSHEKHLTLWRANNAGYCSSKQMAGVYEAPREGYHNSEGNLPVPVQQLDPLFVEVDYEEEKRLMIPNDSRTWKALNVRMDKRQSCLVRIGKTVIADPQPQ